MATSVSKLMALLLPLLVFLLAMTGGVEASKHEQRLIRQLTKNYNPEIRPVNQRNKTTEVAFEAEMAQLISVKERDQVHGVAITYSSIPL